MDEVVAQTLISIFSNISRGLKEEDFEIFVSYIRLFFIQLFPKSTAENLLSNLRFNAKKKKQTKL